MTNFFAFLWALLLGTRKIGDREVVVYFYNHQGVPGAVSKKYLMHFLPREGETFFDSRLTEEERLGLPASQRWIVAEVEHCFHQHPIQLWVVVVPKKGMPHEYAQ